MLFVEGVNRVFENGGIAIAQFVILVDEGFLGLVVALGGVFLGLEEVFELAGLIDLAEGSLREHSAFDLIVAELFVAFEDDLAHLHLGFLVDDDVEDDFVLAGHVVALDNFDLGIVVTLVVEIFLGQDLGTVNHVGRNLCTAHDAQLVVHVLALGLLQSGVVDGADTGTGCQMDAEVDFGTYDGVGCDSDLREQSVPPISTDGLGNLCTRHADGLSDGEARES